MELLFWLIVGHAVCDYPLQGDFLAKAKNHRAPLPGVPWWIALSAHSAIHAGAVAFATGVIAIGVIEWALHCLIDFAKCEGWTGFKIDQALHVVCKIGFVIWIGASP